MVRLITAEGEALVLRWRPHFGSRWAAFAAALLWVGYGVLGFWVERQVRAENPTWVWVGFLLFLVVAVAHTTGARLLRAPGVGFGLAWSIIALAALILGVLGSLPTRPAGVGVLILGVLATLVDLGRVEFTRRQSVHDLTNRRLILRAGLGTRTERTIDLDKIETVTGAQPLMGGLFGFGTLTLQLESKSRKANVPPPREVLAGVPRWEEARHRFEILLDEQRLTAKERAKRGEERRLQDSMRALAGWTAAQR